MIVKDQGSSIICSIGDHVSKVTLKGALHTRNKRVLCNRVGENRMYS